MPQSELLKSHHVRRPFSCGVEELDRYFHQQAGQDRRRNITVGYVLTDPDTEDIIGYYTLNSAVLLPRDLSSEMAKRLPRYQDSPAILIGRLAVDQRFQKQGYGGILLVDALQRCRESSEKIGAMAVIVEAKNEAARTFYQRFGFRGFEDIHSHLFMPMTEIEPV